MIFFLSCNAALTPPSFETEMILIAQSTFDMGMPDVEVVHMEIAGKKQPNHSTKLRSLHLPLTKQRSLSGNTSHF